MPLGSDGLPPGKEPKPGRLQVGRHASDMGLRGIATMARPGQATGQAKSGRACFSAEAEGSGSGQHTQPPCQWSGLVAGYVAAAESLE